MQNKSISQNLEFTEDFKSVVIDYRILFEEYKRFLFFYKYIPTSLASQFVSYLYKYHFNNQLILFVPSSKASLKIRKLCDILFNSLNFYIYELEIHNQLVLDRNLYLLNPSVFYTIPTVKSNFRNVVYIDKLFSFEK